ncbi:predicted protein [Chaetomium globosum CBS 148.51]|uniref:Uncharacterized protein n=1 Tax=Chaetomium globosum (strain ATCC 6205 / CBS 148.51 / DSM 1962 / NBRC 6347 / NRRL 1970) TaxID=306901 RepID=Q2H530_CHAGB|nr:uncharacterized protein CHGG_06235 [Chaetomium globosum CBS 148.51]EAQ89616.1 predicted protein [Chaetomium globosum CBS 148.51]
MDYFAGHFPPMGLDEQGRDGDYPATRSEFSKNKNKYAAATPEPTQSPSPEPPKPPEPPPSPEQPETPPPSPPRPKPGKRPAYSGKSVYFNIGSLDSRYVLRIDLEKFPLPPVDLGNPKRKYPDSQCWDLVYDMSWGQMNLMDLEDFVPPQWWSFDWAFDPKIKEHPDEETVFAF